MPETLQQEGAYHDEALLSSSTYDVKVTIETKRTIMYPIVSLIDSRAARKLMTVASTEPQSNSCMKHQDTNRLWTNSKEPLAVTGLIDFHVHMEGYALEHGSVKLTIWLFSCLWGHRLQTVTYKRSEKLNTSFPYGIYFLVHLPSHIERRC